MWKLALIQGSSVRIFDANGEDTRAFSSFSVAVATLLQDGWEPFQAVQADPTLVVWLRLKAA